MIWTLLGLAALQAAPPGRVLDDFERIDRWSAHPAQSVSATLSAAPGHQGRALRMDFDYHGGGGYAIARRVLPLDLPDNYQFSFWLKGVSPVNTLEFKLADSTGESVWWYTERDRTFDGQWHQITVRKRQIAFAWGPAGGGEIHHVASLEIVITAGKGGGKGSVWIDELQLTPRPVILPYDGTPLARASLSLPGFGAARILDHDSTTSWRSRAGARTATVTVDFGRERELGGLALRWEKGRRSLRYAIEASPDGTLWRVIARVSATGPRDALFLPDQETRYLRFTLHDPEEHTGFGLAELTVQPLSAGASRNAFFETVAHSERAGLYPRYWTGQRAWWTVVGQAGAREEALVSEDGAIEPGTGAFSVEPFIAEGGELDSWRDGTTMVGLTDSTLPMPWIVRENRDLRLSLTAFATGPAEHSSVIARYRVINLSRRARRPVLYLAVRPFQVNPPSQFLNHPGGFTRIDSLRWIGSGLKINGDRMVVPFRVPTTIGLTAMADGEIVSRIEQGRVSLAREAHDPAGTASGALGWALNLAPGDSTEVSIEIPLKPNSRATVAPGPPARLAERLAAARREWHQSLEQSSITLPGSGSALSQSITSTLGYILVNRDSAAIQPGSRSYERSWIRDGALTSTALLRFGHAAEVRQFIEWYAGYIGADGRVPCCVDNRGADPVPEHDSHGEFIYLVMEYWRHTGDRALLTEMWPKVAKVATYLDSLRQSERTAAYQTGADTIFFGLLPASISHEGYSAKAQHSYWDDFFGVRGLRDASAMALVLGDTADAGRLGRDADQFEADLLRSINSSMAVHSIDFIPGSADLGDFDATSTTIALSPVGAEGWLPAQPLRHTFERYWQNTRALRHGSEWEAYTPYELRTVGALLRLDQTERAWTLLDEFLADQEPPAWHQWPEVVFHDPRALRFIGDLPHTWVGSDFLRSAADLFAWEREADSALVLGQGIKSAWLEGNGVMVTRLHTWWGPLTYHALAGASGMTLDIEAGVRVPSGGIVVALPQLAGHRVSIDGASVAVDSSGRVIIRSLPSHITAQ